MDPRPFLPGSESELLSSKPCSSDSGHSQRLRNSDTGLSDTTRGCGISTSQAQDPLLHVLILEACKAARRLVEQRVVGLGDGSVGKALTVQT